MANRDLPLDGKLVVITGASRGIGRAIAERLAAAGAEIVAAARTLKADGDRGSAEETAALIRSRGGKASAMPVDMEDGASRAALIKGVIDRFGRIDVLVNNAGVVERSTLEELDDATFQREIDVIARGTMLCTQAAYAVMKRQGGGKIVNISSISGKLSGAFSAPSSPGKTSARSGPAYALAKGGVIAFTKWVARDGGPHGIQVNAICPGTIDTEMTRGYTYNVGAVPVGRIGSPRDVALAALFLASQMSNYVTGQTLNVDGGILMD